MTAAQAFLVVALVFLVLASAILSLAEVSIIRVRRSRVEVEAASGSRRAEELLALIDDLPVVVNTVLLVVLLLQVSVATISGFLAEQWFGRAWITAAPLAVTLVLFLYAEVIPKTVAVWVPHRMALQVTRPVALMVRVLRPLVRALIWLADRQTPGIEATGSAFGEEELRLLARQSAEEGLIEHSDAELVDRSFRFGDLRVGDVMVLRGGIASVRVDQTAASALSYAIARGHRRLLVHDGDLDHMVGAARLRDLAAAVADDDDTCGEEVTVDAVVAPVLRCSPLLPLHQLLPEMQEAGSWLAVVVDDDGRTVGLVTIEDVVAELVGEISEA